MCSCLAAVFFSQLNPDTFMPSWSFREHQGGNEEHIHCLSSGQEKHHRGLAFTCFSGKDDRAFSRSLTENRKPFGCMPAFGMSWRSAKFNFTPRISRDPWSEHLISLFLNYMSKTSSVHEEFWTRRLLWIIFPTKFVILVPQSPCLQ